MKTIRFAVTLLIVVCAVSGSAICQEASPVSQPASAPATAPAPDRVVMTIGEKQISAGLIDRILAAQVARMQRELTADQTALFRGRLIDQIIEKELVDAHLGTVELSDAEFEAHKAKMEEMLQKQGTSTAEFLARSGQTEEMLRKSAKMAKIQAQAMSERAVKGFIATSPASYFDGTKVHARHILIPVKVYEPDEKKAAAKKKCLEIAAEIQAGTKTFAQAAKEYSACPSSAEGGDLGEFTFDRMTPPFSMVAFSLEPGKVSDPILTEFGYHLIAVDGRSAGSGEKSESAVEVAKQVLFAKFRADVLTKALKIAPVTVAQ